jgi:hypothetical protein
MGASLRASLHPALPPTINQDLKDCILGGASPCQSNVEKPLTLYYPISSIDPASAQGLYAVSGPDSQPVYYDDKGAMCATSTACQFFSVSTSFIATCAGAASSCATADSIVVHFKINSNVHSAIPIPIASIDQRAPSVSRSSIFPNSISSSLANVSVLLLPSAGTALTADQIRAAIIAGGMTDSHWVDTATAAFQLAGFTSLEVITEMTKGAVSEGMTNVGNFTNVMNSIAPYNVTDPALARYLVTTWVAEIGYAKVVIDSGIRTQPHVVGELIHTGITDPVRLAAIVNAVSALPDDELSGYIAGTMNTDPAVALQLRNLVSWITRDGVAAGIIRSGATDSARVNALLAAVSGVTRDRVAAAIAGLGITDSALANQLAAIVAPITSDGQAEWIIRNLEGDPVAMQNYVNGMVAGTISMDYLVPPPDPSTLPTSTSSSVTLIENCTTCQPLTF